MRGQKHQPIKAGDRFGRLTVVGFKGAAKSGHLEYDCKCDCGAKCVASGSAMRTGNTASCGCLWRERHVAATKARETVHGLSKHPLFGVWTKMVNRCTDPTAHNYARYGGRGIRVCDRWADRATGFPAFLADMPPRPTAAHTIDRFPDADGNYEPGNVRWATKTEQARNRASNVPITVGDKTQLACDWAAETGLSRSVIHARLKRGWEPARAVTTPARPLRRRLTR